MHCIEDLVNIIHPILAKEGFILDRKYNNIWQYRKFLGEGAREGTGLNTEKYDVDINTFTYKYSNGTIIQYAHLLFSELKGPLTSEVKVDTILLDITNDRIIWGRSNNTTLKEKVISALNKSQTFIHS